ncbi:hypothetical protein EC973_004677 [Apophysomyces ossiformis]|uniref:Uncharacterized protein n=1 Tax=Apophysomyces ossiformis TaxID=679940 RepID=A0A8H7ELM3_9FUNG|nr:hypothetical protein EC973_004677 [Apophysomyces ossiformis]
MDQDNANDSYLAMLNNPKINPPRNPPRTENSQTTPLLASADFSAATSVQQSLKETAGDLMLVSETDAPFESLNIAWDKSTLPTVEELIDLGLVEEDGDRDIKSLTAFFEPLTSKANDPYKQASGFRALLEKFKELFGESEDSAKVYLIGEITITVLVLGLIRGDDDRNALVGLKSILVES